MGVLSPDLRGTTSPPTQVTGPLLRSARWVYSSSCSPESGASTLLSVPTIIDPTYWLGDVPPGRSGLGYPGPLFGPAPSPWAFVIRRRPLCQTTALGYQPVGILP